MLWFSLSACEPPTPILAKLASPVLTAQRRMSGPLLVVLSYDSKKTPCGEVNFLRATFDGRDVTGSAGSRVVDKTTGVETCEFPNYTIPVSDGTMPREILLTDDITAVRMTIDTLNVGSASADFPPATLRPGYVLRWSASPPSAGTKSWNVIFTPEAGAPVTWGEGGNLSSSFSVTVPPVTTAASGVVAATWLVNAAVTKCEGVGTCTAAIQGAGTFPAVVAP
jgi:hypothetical protein